MSDSNWDVVVIGAGPAGATAAALLAEKGRKVLVLEKEKFPRYHVGESMMPFCWFTLDRLGIVGKMDQIGFQQKHSVQFVSTDGQVSKPFYCFEHDDRESAVTWQVERMVFDQMLVDRAKELGAEVQDEQKVTQLIKDESGAVTGVSVEDLDGEKRDVFG